MKQKQPTRLEIMAIVWERGSSFRKISVANKLSPNAISASFSLLIPRAHRALSDFVGIPVQVIWPQWYDAQGNRLSLRSTSKHSAKRPQRHSKKSSRHLTKNGSAA